MRLFGWKGLLALGTVMTAFLWGVGTASAAFHGIGTTKGCVSPVKIGDPYACSVQILNVVDTGHDTLRVTGLSDQVNSAGGAVQSGNIMPFIGLVFSGAVNCTGGRRRGAVGEPVRRGDLVSAPVRNLDHDHGLHALHDAGGRLQFAESPVDPHGDRGLEQHLRRESGQRLHDLAPDGRGGLVGVRREAADVDGNGYPQPRASGGDRRRGAVHGARLRQ